MLAYRAAGDGAPIDSFVLWGMTSRGREVVRQMRAFSRMESSEFFLGLEPPAPLCAVFLNAGAQYRIGPNRMWTEAARRWAAQGVASLRLDMLGIGESDGELTPYTRDVILYGPEFQARVTAVLDELERSEIAERFLLVGMCAGAYWGLHAGLGDDRVAGIMMLNPAVVIWDDHLGGARDLRRLFTDRSWRLIRKNATPQRLRAVARTLAGMPVRSLARRISPQRAALARDAGRGAPRPLGGSGAAARLGSLPHITIGRLPVNDHTVRAIAIQRLVHQELDAELRRVLDSLDGSG